MPSSLVHFGRLFSMCWVWTSYCLQPTILKQMVRLKLWIDALRPTWDACASRTPRSGQSGWLSLNGGIMQLHKWPFMKLLTIRHHLCIYLISQESHLTQLLTDPCKRGRWWFNFLRTTRQRLSTEWRNWLTMGYLIEYFRLRIGFGLNYKLKNRPVCTIGVPPSWVPSILAPSRSLTELGRFLINWTCQHQLRFIPQCMLRNWNSSRGIYLTCHISQIGFKEVKLIENILAKRLVKRQNKAVVQFLIQWQFFTAYQATWKFSTTFWAQYPLF